MFSFVLTFSIFMDRDEVDGRLLAKDRGVKDDQASHNGKVVVVVTTNSKPTI
jgi:hypothetical protein